MIRYIWFIRVPHAVSVGVFIILSSYIASIYSADEDETKISDSNVPLPNTNARGPHTLQYWAQKVIAKKIMDEQDSIVPRLGQSIRFEIEGLSFHQAMDQVKSVDRQMKALLPTLLVKGVKTNFFAIPDIVQKNKKLLQAIDATWSHYIRRNQRLCTLLNEVVVQASDILNEYTLDTVHDTLQSLPSWAFTDIVSRFHLATEYKCTEKELSKKVIDVSALHIGANGFFISRCLNEELSKKVELISLAEGHSRILQGNSFCVHQFVSLGHFLFGVAPYKTKMYKNAHLYIWDVKTKAKCQALNFSGKIVGIGLNGSYCFVVDSFGVVHCLSFNKKEKKFEAISKFPFKRPVHAYQMLGSRYAYSTDNEKIIFGQIDCSGMKPINNEMSILDCPASTLFFLSDTELLACQQDHLFYITIDDERRSFVSVPQKLRTGHVQDGMVLHGKLVYQSSDNEKLYTYDPRLHAYGESVSDTYNSYNIDRFYIAFNTLIAYDATSNNVWSKGNRSDFKSLLTTLLIHKDRADLDLLKEHSRIIKTEWDDFIEKKDVLPSYLLKILYRADSDKKRRAALLNSSCSTIVAQPK